MEKFKFYLIFEFFLKIGGNSGNFGVENFRITTNFETNKISLPQVLASTFWKRSSFKKFTEVPKKRLDEPSFLFLYIKHT